MNTNKHKVFSLVLQESVGLIIPLLVLFFVLLLHLNSYSQGKEANIWYFGFKAGVDFNPGSPPATLLNSQMNAGVGSGGNGCASIADSTGLLLFYSNGVTILNKNHVPMLNGQDMGSYSTQGAIIVPQPGSNHLYYFFNFIGEFSVLQYHFQYSVIDMNLDNGNGGVVATQKGIRLFNNSTFHLSAVSHANGHDVWVLAHSSSSNNYYAYLVTTDSLHHTPVISQAGSDFDDHTGYMKISPDGKKVAAATYGGNGSFFDLVDFDNETGMVNDDNMVHSATRNYYGVEFSPDNSKLYTEGGIHLFQYDLNAGSPQDILDSEVLIADVTTGNGALQLGPDGKIYCSLGTSLYLSVINQPNKLGLTCNFEQDAVYLKGRYANGGLPSFIQSYLNDPSFSTQYNCVGDATTFVITETNGIDSVFWKFNDFPNQPNDTSTLFSPAYVFSNAGTFFVDLTVYSGLLEKTVTQEVIIHPLPEPELGNDTLFCDTNFSITLNPNCNAASYFWNTWATTQEIIVNDTGTYWVKATSAEGCSNRDTINIGLYPKPLLDENNLAVTNTGCGQNNGSITGLQVVGTPPLAYYWINIVGDTIGFNLDVLNLSAGAYSLVVAYSECSSMIATYLVEDDGNLQIDSIAFTNDHCSSGSATLAIYANTTNPDILTYSIDGVNFLPTGGVFTNLSEGSYIVMTRDSNNCEGYYENNPVIIQNIAGVEIISDNITPENDFSSDGSIYLEAIVAGGDIYYSIYNGSSPQTNNGLFQNLSAGLYYCKVWDGFGCDTTFEVIVPRNTTTILEAISGFGNACVNDTVVSSLNLEQFNGVFSFVAKIYYDINVVNCVGYIDLLPELEAVFNANISTPGEVILTWQGTLPLTLPDTVMTKLVFGGLGEGVSLIYWEAGPGQSVFFDQKMDTINAVCYVGEVQIFSSPEIDMQPNEKACSGDTILVEPTVTDGNGTIIYEWTGPNDYQSQNYELVLSPANINQTGTYTLTVIDTMYCQKSQNININVIPSPEIAFSGYDTLWVEPGFLLDAGYGAESYYWNTGETTETIVIDSMGNYIVEVTSYENCKSTDAIQILWAGTPFYLPNAFTPNGDGLNDSFGPILRYDYVNRYHMSIYNRWGQVIYETTDINKGWDGTYKGSPCMLGAYVYRIVYEEFGQQPIESKVVEGTVMLVR